MISFLGGRRDRVLNNYHQLQGIITWCRVCNMKKYVPYSLLRILYCDVTIITVRWKYQNYVLSENLLSGFGINGHQLLKPKSNLHTIT